MSYEGFTEEELEERRGRAPGEWPGDRSVHRWLATVDALKAELAKVTAERDEAKLWVRDSGEWVNVAVRTLKANLETIESFRALLAASVPVQPTRDEAIQGIHLRTLANIDGAVCRVCGGRLHGLRRVCETCDKDEWSKTP